MSASPAKRKAINDFFQPLSKRVKQSELIEHHEAKAIPPSKIKIEKIPVPGLSLHNSFVSTAEELTILTFLNDPSECTWRTDLSRRTMHFGGTYCLMPAKSSAPPTEPQIIQAPPIPPEFGWLVQRFVDEGVFHNSQRPQYCIVNEYTRNNGISAHTENFQFGEPVVGLSLLSACPIRFHELTKPFDGSVRSGKAGKAEKTGRRVDVGLPARSLLVMRGESRWKWQHEIVKGGKNKGADWKRVSLTFRYKNEGQ